RMPQIERVDRLHVIMAVEQDPRPWIGALATFADHHRMTGGRAQTDVEAKSAEIGRNVFRGLAALRGISGVRRNRLNSQQGEQPIETGIELAIDLGQDRGHGIICTHVRTVIIDRRLERTRFAVNGAGLRRRFYSPRPLSLSSALDGDALQVCNAYALSTPA